MTAKHLWIAVTGFMLSVPMLLPMAAAAQVAPNIRYVDYNADGVIRLTGHTGYQMMLEFEPGERIETVGIGDSSGWQVTPNGAGTIMFLKPIGLPPITNLSVITNLRRYNLELGAKSGLRVPQSQITYAVRFRYVKKAGVGVQKAAPPPLIATLPEFWNRRTAMTVLKPMSPNWYLMTVKRLIFNLRRELRHLRFSALRLMQAKASSILQSVVLMWWLNKSRRSSSCAMARKLR